MTQLSLDQQTEITDNLCTLEDKVLSMYDEAYQSKDNEACAIYDELLTLLSSFTERKQRTWVS